MRINIANAIRRQKLEKESRNYREELETMVRTRTAELENTLEKLHRTTVGVIEAMALTLESRDPYTAGHQRRVASLAVEIAKTMNFPEDRIRGLHMAGMIHDLGKISVPAEILSKPGRLNDMEFGIIKTHPQVGYDILKEIDFPGPVAQTVYQHHERLDGSGYPNGLGEGDILLEARILSVSDVVEAMASHRPYRPALGIDMALKEIRKKEPKHYDPPVVDACVEVFKSNRIQF